MIRPFAIIRRVNCQDLSKGSVGKYAEEKLELENLVIDILKKIISALTQLLASETTSIGSTS